MTELMIPEDLMMISGSNPEPSIKYLITNNREQLDNFLSYADKYLGYPESPESLRWIGGGRHAAKEIGRAMHYAPIEEHKDGGTFALPLTEKLKAAIAEGKIEDVSKTAGVSVVEKLPDGWYPELEMV